MMKTPYSHLKRDCQNLHNFSDRDVKKFIEVAKIKKGDIILDAMAGSGAISKELSKIQGVQLFVLDNAKLQIEEAKKNVKNAKFYVSSSLQMPFQKNMFDKVFIRNAVYEVQKKEQVKLYREILRVLKKEGLFVNWTFKLDNNNKEIFNKLVRKKDEIAGFSDLVQNRYFMTKGEFEEDIKNAGFSSVKFVDLGINYTLSTKKWLDIDFKSDKNKFEELNQYIKNIKDITGIKINDLGKEGFEIKLPALISIAIK